MLFANICIASLHLGCNIYLLLVVFAIYFQHDSTIYKTRELHHGRSNSFKGKKELLTTPRGVHSLLYIAYTCIWDLFIGGLFTLQKIL